ARPPPSPPPPRATPAAVAPSCPEARTGPAAPQPERSSRMSPGTAYLAGVNYLAGNPVDGRDTRLVRWRDEFYEWSRGRYRPVSDRSVQDGLARWLARNPGARTTSSQQVRPVTAWYLRDAMLAVHAEAAIPDEIEPGSWIDAPPEGAVGPCLATPGG